MKQGFCDCVKSFWQCLP